MNNTFILPLLLILSTFSCSKERTSLTAVEFENLKKTISTDEDISKVRAHFYEYTRLSGSFPPSEFRPLLSKMQSCNLTVISPPNELKECLVDLPRHEYFIEAMENFTTYVELVSTLEKKYPDLILANSEQRNMIFMKMNISQTEQLLTSAK